MRTKEILRRTFYMDDCLTSVPTDDEAINVIAKLRSALTECGFYLTKWISNSKSALASVLQENRAEGSKSLYLEGLLKERVLGAHWEVAYNQMYIRINTLSKPCTRRGILSMSHYILDPLDIVAPVLIEPKLLLRELCDHGWDDAINSEKIERRQSWLSSLCHLEGLHIP